MLKCIDDDAAAKVRVPSGTSWTRMATSPARASEGTASAANAAKVTTSFCIRRPVVNGASPGFALGARSPFDAYNPDSVKRLLLAVFLLAMVFPAGAAAAPSKVLAIHFTSDVNPVTQDWVNHELSSAQSHGYA